MDVKQEKKKPKRCHAPDCKKKIGALPFHCSSCNEDFCVVHRMPECHSCLFLEQMRLEKKEKLADGLIANKCVASKI